jgi:hypothetical protein
MRGFIHLNLLCGEVVKISLSSIKDVRPFSPSPIALGASNSGTTIELKDGRIYDVDTPIEEILKAIQWC